jgi:hypothetical protein
MTEEKLADNHKENPRESENPCTEELAPLLEDPNIPESTKKKIISKISIIEASSSKGPLPPPEMLKGYNEVVRVGAEKILSKFRIMQKSLKYSIRFLRIFSAELTVK